MPALFQGYCYSTLTEAGNALLSGPPIAGSAGVAWPHTFTTTAIPNQLQIVYGYKPYSATAQTTYATSRTLPACTNVGYLTNYSGMNLTDVVTTSWLVVFVWVSAWAIKTMRGRA